VADLTPIQQVDGIMVKRDDLYRFGEASGGKARACAALATGVETGLITAGARHSPQVAIVARVAAHMGIPARVHVPAGEQTDELQIAEDMGAEVVRHRPGYNSVIVARAHEDAERSGWKEIPFGMECEAAVDATRGQAHGLPDFERLVVAVGSGMSLAGILWGLKDAERWPVPVLGVVVGADPLKRLLRWAPPGTVGQLRLEPAGVPYSKREEVTVGSIHLDPIYEAKVAPHLRGGDLLWVIGHR
jgi:1-aminocyclopropane-1-carboxylate deaminase/D-cysteine desulfhydrase-like pyridoxal-dependent ACC family enzyme